MLSILYSSMISAYGLEPTQIHSWIGSQAPTHHAEFFHAYGDLTESFYRGLISWSNSQLKRSAKSAVVLHQRDQCTEGALFKSMSSKSIDPNTTVEETEFIESLFLIESSYCIPDVKVEQAYDVFMSKEFRVDVMPQVIGFTKTGNSSCVTSSGVTGILLPSEYCTHNRELKDSETVVLYSSLQSAYTDSDHQPLYFREEVIVFSQLSSGVAVYRATFSRSQDLGTTSKYLLRNTVSTSQSKIRDGYYEWLKK